jgi:hypothetical protein
MHSRARMNVRCASSRWHSNTRTFHAATATAGRASSQKGLPASARAVRPLAASARPKLVGAASGLCAEPSFGVEVCLPAHGFLGTSENRTHIQAQAFAGAVSACSQPMQALRRGAKPNTRGRAGTRCCAARAGGVRLLASGTTQRTMHAGCVPQCALPNPSINRTSPGKPGAAGYLKR